MRHYHQEMVPSQASTLEGMNFKFHLVDSTLAEGEVHVVWRMKINGNPICSKLRKYFASLLVTVFGLLKLQEHLLECSRSSW